METKIIKMNEALDSLSEVLIFDRDKLPAYLTPMLDTLLVAGEELCKDVPGLVQQVEELEGNLENAQTENYTLEARINDLQYDLDSVKSDLESKERTIDELACDLKEAREEVARLEAKLDK